MKEFEHHFINKQPMTKSYFMVHFFMKIWAQNPEIN